jgi:hypothetical protein
MLHFQDLCDGRLRECDLLDAYVLSHLLSPLVVGTRNSVVTYRLRC